MEDDDDFDCDEVPELERELWEASERDPLVAGLTLEERAEQATNQLSRMIREMIKREYGLEPPPGCDDSPLPDDTSEYARLFREEYERLAPFVLPGDGKPWRLGPYEPRPFVPFSPEEVLAPSREIIIRRRPAPASGTAADKSTPADEGDDDPAGAEAE